MGQGIFSTCLYDIAVWLRLCGVRVHLHASELPDDVGGMYRHETREIFINQSGARDALLTLAHEAGHWFGYLLDEKEHSYQRERQAFAYGWRILKLFDAPVTRAKWIEDERSRREAALLPGSSTRDSIEHLYREAA